MRNRQRHLCVWFHPGEDGPCHPEGFISVSFPLYCLWVRSFQEHQHAGDLTPSGLSVNAPASKRVVTYLFSAEQ